MRASERPGRRPPLECAHESSQLQAAALGGDLLAARARRTRAAPQRADGSRTHHAAELTAAAFPPGVNPHSRNRKNSSGRSTATRQWPRPAARRRRLGRRRSFEALRLCVRACHIAHAHGERRVRGVVSLLRRAARHLSEAAGAKAANPDAFSALRAEALENAAAVYAAQSDAAAARNNPSTRRRVGHRGVRAWPRRGRPPRRARPAAAGDRVVPAGGTGTPTSATSTPPSPAHLVRLASATAGQARGGRAARGNRPRSPAPARRARPKRRRSRSRPHRAHRGHLRGAG